MINRSRLFLNLASMNSTKCHSCNLVQWSDGSSCKRCGAALVATAFTPAANASPYNHYQTAYSGAVSQDSSLKTGLALASMILGIVAFPTMFVLIGILIAPIAVILGIVAIRKASNQPQVYGGKPFAIAGIVTGSMVCLFIPLIAAIAIPNLLAARRAANEGSAMNAVEVIAAAQSQHSSMDPDGACGDLMMLASKNLISSELSSGKRSGYKFVSKGNADDLYSCEVQATPVSKSHGNYSFYYSSADGVLRISRDGLPADHNDAPMDLGRQSD